MSIKTGEIWPIDKAKLWDKNPRQITPEDFDRLKEQIKKLGVYKPLVVKPDGTILGGNMRYRALKELGQKEVWVSIVHPKTEAEELEFALSDNDRAGSYNEQDLAEMVQLLPVESLKLYKIDTGRLLPLQELKDKYGPTPGEDEAPAPPEGEPSSKAGEVYELGPHRLMCGDSTNPEDVQMLMGDKKADLVLTDPPYNVDYVGKTKDALTLENDNQTAPAYFEMLKGALLNARQYAKKGAVIYLFHADSEGLVTRQAFADAGWILKQTLIWVKQHMVMGRQDYQWQHEPVLYGWADGAPHYFISDRKQTTVWQYDRPSASREHPTMKPIALLDRMVRNSSKGEDIVLDLFGGSGSTLIAAEKAGRVCYMMELDPRYCDVIRERYAKLKEES